MGLQTLFCTSRATGTLVHGLFRGNEKSLEDLQADLFLEPENWGAAWMLVRAALLAPVQHLDMVRHRPLPPQPLRVVYFNKGCYSA